jgi:hypothetical protein
MQNVRTTPPLLLLELTLMMQLTHTHASELTSLIVLSHYEVLGGWMVPSCTNEASATSRSSPISCSCTAVVFIITEDFMRKPYPMEELHVAQEWKHRLHHNFKFVPVLYKVEFDKLEEFRDKYWNKEMWDFIGIKKGEHAEWPKEQACPTWPVDRLLDYTVRRDNQVCVLCVHHVQVDVMPCDDECMLILLCIAGCHMHALLLANNGNAQQWHTQRNCLWTIMAALHMGRLLAS